MKNVPTYIKVKGNLYKQASTEVVLVKKQEGAVPEAIRVKGHLYRRADEGPTAKGVDPKPMSDKAVLAVDMGIPVEDLKEYKHPDGHSAYDLIQKYLK